MYKTISYWTAPQPQDVAAFEEFYQQVHGPMAARVPGVQKLELSRTSDGFAGEPSPFYRVAEMYFHDREAMDIATMTPEWAELVPGGSQDWTWRRGRGSASAGRAEARDHRQTAVARRTKLRQSRHPPAARLGLALSWEGRFHRPGRATVSTRSPQTFRGPGVLPEHQSSRGWRPSWRGGAGRRRRVSRRGR
jgi:uncharacterized protein (TIGR02118 family)